MTAAKAAAAVADARAGLAPPDGEPLLHFDADAVVRGVVFHVVDEGLARGVADESVAALRDALRRRATRPSVPRATWAAMTHHERLDWLLAQAGAVPFVGDDDVVTLNLSEPPPLQGR